MKYYFTILQCSTPATYGPFDTDIIRETQAFVECNCDRIEEVEGLLFLDLNPDTGEITTFTHRQEDLFDKYLAEGTDCSVCGGWVIPGIGPISGTYLECGAVVHWTDCMLKHYGECPECQKKNLTFVEGYPCLTH